MSYLILMVSITCILLVNKVSRYIITDGEDMVCLELLVRLLHPRGLAKNSVFLKHVEVC